MARRRRRVWPWLVVCCVLIVGVFVWLGSRGVVANVGTGPSTLATNNAAVREPTGSDVAEVTDAGEDCGPHEIAPVAYSDEEERSSLEEDVVAAPLDAVDSARHEADYTTPDPTTPEPGAPAAQAFSPEADAAVQAASADADLPRHVEEEVLLSVPEGTTRAELEEMLEGIDFVSLEDASEADLEMGFVVLPLAEGISVSEAATRLHFVDGIDNAEPNLILTLADDIANPAAFARILDPMASLHAAAAIGDELADELVALTGESDTETMPAEERGEDAEAVVVGDAEEEAAPQSDSAAEEADSQADGQPGEQALDVQAEGNGVEDLAADLMTAEEATINDEYAADQWALGSINAYAAWGLAKCEGGVGIAVIDTGALLTHEDLSANIVSAYYNSATQSTSKSSATDGYGHGTHVAGIACAVANNGKGVAGVSYNANLLVIKASEGTTDKFSADSVVRAYGWLLSKPSGSSKSRAEAHNIRVINLSVAVKDTEGYLDNPDDALLTKIQEAYDAGILTVCAAGNNASDGAYACYPGDFEPALSVINLQQSSSDQSGVVRASGSNYNVAGSDAKDISAPGSGIYSTTYDGYYGTMSGTSMASPCVAGAAALVFSVDPALSPAAVTNLLERTANRTANLANQQHYGSGEVDASTAVEAVVGPHIVGGSEVWVGATESYRVKVGNAVSPDTWTWSSSDTSVATIDGSGTLVARMAGTTTISATSSDGATSCTLDVSVLAKIDLSSATVSLSQTSYTYDGTAKKPTVTVRLGDTTVPSSGYTIAYSVASPISPGTYTVTVAGTGKYTGSVKRTYTITSKSLSGATVALLQTEYVYDGKAKTPTVTVTLSGRKLTQGTDYGVSYANNTAAGTATVTITGKGGYTGTIKKTFAIVKCSISGSATAYVGLPIKLTASPSRTWTWSSSNASVAVVSSVGMVTPRKAGTVTITARSGGLSCTKTITVTSQAFFIYNVNSGLVLDVAGASKAPGANVLQYTLNRNANQRWRMEYRNGHFAIRSVSSGLVLDVSDASKKGGASVIQYAYHGNANQLWDVALNSDGTYTVKNVGSGLVLDVFGASKRAGGNVIQYANHAGSNQKWRFTPVTGVVADGTYRISSAIDASYVIDLKGGSAANGAQVLLWRWNGGTNQRWKLTLDAATGYYRIASAKSGLVIDISGARNANGAQLIQYTYKASNNQLWDVRRNSDGTYTLVSALGGRVIDIPGGKINNGNQLVTWISNSGKNQRWRLTGLRDI